MKLAKDMSGAHAFALREPFAEHWLRVRAPDGAQLFNLLWPPFADRFPAPEMDLPPMFEVRRALDRM